MSTAQELVMRCDRTATWSFKHATGKAAASIIAIPEPAVVAGEGAIRRMGGVIAELGASKPLIVTDKMLVKLGMVQPCIDSLTAAGLTCAVFDEVEPNPHTGLCEAAHQAYVAGGCDSIIAFGGGSPMDCAKVVGAMVANPRPVREYQGMFQVTMMGLKKMPPFVAVPTTAGTGSETTIAAIITIAEERAKITIADQGLVPKVAVLDPAILAGLPKGVTAATGMDALTHAVESFLGGWTTDFTERNSLLAVEKIFKFLLRSFHDGGDMEARGGMLQASFEAGLAFTRANVGYVHAIAHQVRAQVGLACMLRNCQSLQARALNSPRNALASFVASSSSSSAYASQFGGMFHTPHGVANAMVLPSILDFYLADEGSEGDELTCTERFVAIARAAGLESHYTELDDAAQRALASKLVATVRAMNVEMSLPDCVPAMTCTDVAVVATRALKEAHGELHGGFSASPMKHALDLGYPVPKHITQAGCEAIVAQFLPKEEHAKWLAGGGRLPPSKL